MIVCLIQPRSMAPLPSEHAPPNNNSTNTNDNANAAAAAAARRKRNMEKLRRELEAAGNFDKNDKIAKHMERFGVVNAVPN